MDRADATIEALAATQMQRFTRAQVAQLDPRGPALVQARLRSGKWRRLTTRVLCLPGAPTGRAADLWTASLHLGPDAVVSHFSAARVHGLPVERAAPDALTVPRGSHRSYEGVVVYQRGDLGSGDVISLDGLAVTSLARTLVDLGATVSRARLDSWLDQLTSERRVTPVEVAAVVERVSRSGKPLVPALLRALSARLPGAGVEQGPLERSLTDVARRAAVGPSVAQYPHPGRPDGGEFVDRAWIDARLIVEADGRCWHDRISAARSDARRDRAAARAGWVTVRFRYEDLTGDPEGCAQELRAIIERRLDDLGRDAPPLEPDS